MERTAMPNPEIPADPFAKPRDKTEAEVDRRVREFFLAVAHPSAVYRQHPGGYALIAPQSSGARALTVPAANEADFMFHGAEGQGVGALARFIVAALAESGADHLKLPLLSAPQAAVLKAELGRRQTDWIWADSLSAVAPTISRKPETLPPNLRYDVKRAQRVGLRLERSISFEREEVRALHQCRWGEGNRSASFFGMLEMLVKDCNAEYFVARSGSGELLAAQVDIVGGRTRHFYYCVSDKRAFSGVGTAVMAVSWIAFLEGKETVYSFGRGTERYKYRYADSVRTLFELRGFLAPVAAGGPASPPMTP